MGHFNTLASTVYKNRSALSFEVHDSIYAFIKQTASNKIEICQIEIFKPFSMAYVRTRHSVPFSMAFVKNRPRTEHFGDFWGTRFCKFESSQNGGNIKPQVSVLQPNEDRLKDPRKSLFQGSLLPQKSTKHAMEPRFLTQQKYQLSNEPTF